MGNHVTGSGPDLPSRYHEQKQLLPQNLDPAIGALFEDGALDFRVIADVLPDPREIDDSVLTLIQNAVVRHIHLGFRTGHWRDLKGADRVLEKLEMTGLGFSDEVRADLNMLLKRLPDSALDSLGLSQPAGIDEHDHEAARRILKRRGFTEEELTDERVEQILSMRHILIALHDVGLQQLDAGRAEITAAKKLLGS